MSARSFTIPIISVSDGRAMLPPPPGIPVEEDPPAYAEPRDVARAWIQQGARRLYLVDAGGGSNHGPVSAAISAAHGRASVTLEAAPQSPAGLEAVLSTGCHSAVVDATVPFLAEAVRQHGRRISVKVGVHEAALSTRATARDGSDLWSLLDRLEGVGVPEYVIMNTDHYGHWRHRSLSLLAAVLESIGPPAITFGGVTRLEDLHALVGLSKDGLIGSAVSEGLYSGAFTLAEAEAAVEPRYDPYIWAPPDPSFPQVTDSGQG